MARTAYEVTTENGTRIIIDLAGDDSDDGSRCMRIPALDENGRLNLTLTDGTWRRLLWFYPIDNTQRWDVAGIRIGKRLRLHVGMSDWWDTTTVTHVTPLDQDNLPTPIPRTLDDEDPDE